MWPKRDPLLRMQRFLNKQSLWSEKEDVELRETLNEAFRADIKATEAAGAVPLEWLLEDVYAEMPEHLEEQREWLDS